MEVKKDTMPPLVDLVIEGDQSGVRGDIIMSWAKEVLKKINNKKPNADK